MNTVVVVEIDVPDTPTVFFFYSPYRFLQSEFFENSDCGRRATAADIEYGLGGCTILFGRDRATHRIFR